MSLSRPVTDFDVLATFIVILVSIMLLQHRASPDTRRAMVAW
jgi:hypothetical protein